jgi:hypothetical protein
MKRFIFLAAFVLLFSTSCFASARSIALNRKGMSADHNEFYPPADMPEAYYDPDIQEIIIISDGFASYYDVNIVSQSTMQLVLYTTISGYGDSIDVSSLPDDDYTIIITSSYNNEYEGNFTNY